MKYLAAAILAFFIIITSSTYGQTVRKSYPASFKNQISIDSIKNVEPVNKETGNILDSIRLSYSIKNISTGSSPGRIIIPKHSNKAFILVPDSYKLLIANLDEGEIEDSLVFSDYPVDMILDHSGNFIYVMSWNESLYNGEPAIGPGMTYIINTFNNEIIKEVFPYASDIVDYVEIAAFSQILLSPDDTFLYMIGKDLGIYVFDLQINKLVRVFYKPDYEFKYATVSGDGKRLFVTTNPIDNPYDYQPLIIDFENGIVKEPSGMGSYSFRESRGNITSPDGQTFFTTVYDPILFFYSTAGFNSTTAEFTSFIHGAIITSNPIYNSDSSLAYFQHFHNSLGNLSVMPLWTKIIDMQSFDMLKVLRVAGYNGVLSGDNNRLIFSNNSPEAGRGIVMFGEPVSLGITVSNLLLDKNYTINIYPEEHEYVRYRAIAISADDRHIVVGNSNYNTFSIISDLAELPPLSPSLLEPEDSLSNLPLSIQLKWNKPETAFKYHIQVSDSISFTNLIIEDSTLAAPMYNAHIAQPNTNYYWRVRAWNYIGWSEWSEAYNFKTMDLPAQSVNSLPPDNETSVPIAPVLSWVKIPSAVSYELVVSEDESFSSYIFHDTLITDTLKQLSSLTNGKEYFWKVRGKNAAGYGEFSAAWSFTTIVQKPGIVLLSSPANGTVAGTDSIMFTWNSSQPVVEKYWFELAGDSLFTNAIIDSALTDTSTSHSGLQAKKYWWRVKAFNVAGWSEFSNANEFSILLSGVESNILPAVYSLSQNYPNPFNPSTQIKYSLKEAGHVTLFVYNTLGEKVAELVNQHQPVGSYELMFKNDNIPSGVYLYIIRSGSFSETRKMMLIR